MDNPWHIVEVFALAIWSAGFALVMRAFGNNDRRHGVVDRRLQHLEAHQYTREDAERGRAELKKEVADQIAKVESTLNTHRQESNTQFTELGRKFDTFTTNLFNRLNKADP